MDELDATVRGHRTEPAGGRGRRPAGARGARGGRQGRALDAGRAEGGRRARTVVAGVGDGLRHGWPRPIRPWPGTRRTRWRSGRPSPRSTRTSVARSSRDGDRPFGFSGVRTQASARPEDAGYRLVGCWPFMTGAADAAGRWSAPPSTTRRPRTGHREVRRFVVPARCARRGRQLARPPPPCGAPAATPWRHPTGGVFVPGRVQHPAGATDAPRPAAVPAPAGHRLRRDRCRRCASASCAGPHAGRSSWRATKVSRLRRPRARRGGPRPAGHRRRRRRAPVPGGRLPGRSSRRSGPRPRPVSPCPRSSAPASGRRCS